MHKQPAQKEGWSVVSTTVTLNRIYHISVVRQTLSTITVVCVCVCVLTTDYPILQLGAHRIAVICSLDLN